jgi:hypothetical protein
MADTRALLDGLREYHAGLASQLSRLGEEFQLLEAARLALDGVFQGDAADVFRQQWGRTAEHFRLYLDQGALLARGLEQRIAALESANTELGI